MIRAVLGVILGYAIWTILWLVGNSIFFGEAAKVVGEGKPYTVAGALAGVILLSVICSLAAGFATAAIAGLRSRGAVVVMAALLLLTGIGVQASVWSLMPTWYHLIFLVLIVPVALVGGGLVRRRSSVRA